jgi:hypothetical protein
LDSQTISLYDARRNAVVGSVTHKEMCMRDAGHREIVASQPSSANNHAGPAA